MKYFYPDKTFLETKYLYTSTGKLRKTEHYDAAGTMYMYQEFEFANDRPTKLLIGSPAGKSGETLFTYDGDKLTKIEHLEKKADLSFGKLYEKTFVYVGDQISRVNYLFFNGGSSFYALYEYTGDNITAVQAYDMATGQLLEEDYFQYDDKINPFYQMHSLKTGNVQESSKNNVIHSKVVAHRHIPNMPEVSYSYEYNAEGKPTKRLISAPGKPSVAEETYNYTCK
jgi:hypothetical protein